MQRRNEMVREETSLLEPVVASGVFTRQTGLSRAGRRHANLPDRAEPNTLEANQDQLRRLEDKPVSVLLLKEEVVCDEGHAERHGVAYVRDCKVGRFGYGAGDWNDGPSYGSFGGLKVTGCACVDALGGLLNPHIVGVHGAWDQDFS